MSKYFLNWLTVGLMNLIVLWSSAGAERANESDILLMISYCDTVTVTYDNVNTWPGNPFEIPILITNTDTLIGLDLYVAYPEEMTFTDIDTSGCPWDPDSIVVDHDTLTRTVDIDFRVRGGAFPPAGTPTCFAGLKFDMSSGAGFNSIDTVGFGNRVDARTVADENNDCEVNDTTASIVTIPDDSVAVTFDWITAYSCQGADYTDSVKISMRAKTPVYLYSNFPCSSYCIVFANPQNTKVKGFDAVDPSAQFDTIRSGYYRVYGDLDSLHEDNSTLYLGDIEKDIGCLSSEYNSDTTFSDTLFLGFLESDSSYVSYARCWGCTDSIFYSDIVADTGGIELPQYKVELSLKDAEAEVDGKVEVPVTIKPTFYSADFGFYVEFDSSYIKLDTVLSAGGTVPDLEYTFVSWTTPSTMEYWIRSDPLFQSARYVLPNKEKTLFTMKFTANDSLGLDDTTYVRIDFADDSTNFVYDWFSFDNVASKIVRDDDDGSYFTTDSSCVTNPAGFTLDLPDDLSPYSKNKYSLPVEITELNFVGEDKAEIFYSLTASIDTVLEGAFAFDSVEVIEFLEKIDIYLGEDVDSLGILAHIEFHDDNGGTFILKSTSRMQYDLGGSPAYAYVTKADTCEYHPGTGPRVEPERVLPFAYSLSQNYPNPFNSRTIISFSIPEPGYTKIEIYDIIGRKTKTLISDYLTPGDYLIAWDGSNSANETVSGGVYFYVLKSNQYRESRKMLYLK